MRTGQVGSASAPQGGGRSSLVNALCGSAASGPGGSLATHTVMKVANKVKSKVAMPTIMFYIGYMMRKIVELTQYRKDNGLSRADVGEILGVSPITVWRWEQGQRFPSLKHLPAVAKMCGRSIEELIVKDQADTRA